MIARSVLVLGFAITACSFCMPAAHGEASDPRCERPLSSTTSPEIASPNSLVAAPADPIKYLRDRAVAVRLRAEGKLTEAAPIAEELVRQYACDAYTWTLLGDTRFAANKFVGAAAAYERAMEITGPGTPSGPGYRLAISYVGAGNREKALSTLEELVFKDGYRLRNELYIDPNFESLRTDPRFQRIVGHMDTRQWKRDEGWRHDLDYLVEEIRRLDPAYKNGPLPAEFTLRENALRADIPKLANEEIYVRLAGLLASLGQGHTGMIPFFPSQRFPFTQLPMDLWAFPEGLFIVRGGPGANDLVGGQLLSIEKTPALEALRRVREIHTRESGMEVLWTGPSLVRLAQILKGLGIAPRTDRIAVTVRLLSGNIVRRELATVPMENRPKLVPPPGVPPPLFLRNVSQYHWMSAVSDNTLFVQLNQVQPDPNETLAQFGLTLRKALREQPIRNVILDLRNDNGGNTFLYPELLRTLVQFSADDRNRLYVLIGRWTYSAAANLTSDLQRLAHPVFVGEPTSQTGNQFGDNGLAVLPYSGLTAGITSVRWQLSDPWDRRPVIVPEMPVQLTAKDYFAGRDPALEAIESVIKSGGVPAGEMDPMWP